jgi:NADPH:quinone reductase-like Zn-dependent oxidoreductase
LLLGLIVQTCCSVKAITQFLQVHQIFLVLKSLARLLAVTYLILTICLGSRLGIRFVRLVQGGGYAELCTAPIAQCLPYPKGFTDQEAAALPETFYTVWSNVFMRGALSEGETLLVQGGSSGIGVTAILIAKALGHKVFVTAGTDEKCNACV